MEKSISLTTQPVDSKNYKSYNINQLPKLVLGFNIKNKYDEGRLQFKTKYQPKNILHFISKSEEEDLEPFHMHVLELTPKKKVQHIINLIDNAQPITVHGYKNILKYNNLSCESCFAHIADGIYPIDIDHLSEVCEDYNPVRFEALRNMLETPKDMPWFSNWSSFKLFLLLPCTIY